MLYVRMMWVNKPGVFANLMTTHMTSESNRIAALEGIEPSLRGPSPHARKKATKVVAFKTTITTRLVGLYLSESIA